MKGIKKIKTHINEWQIIVSLTYFLLAVYADNIHSVSIMIIDVCIESRRSQSFSDPGNIVSNWVGDSQSGE